MIVSVRPNRVATVRRTNENNQLLISILITVTVCLTLTHLITSVDAKTVFSGRVPGTKWCGPGNDAQNDTDFGEREDLDQCCYNHDRCEIRPLRPGLTRFGLNNTKRYTKSHCICDKKFNDCLHKIDDSLAALVGRAYFRLTSKCFMEYYPILKCRNKKMYKKYFTSRCLEYEFDKTAPILYQWFDLPLYHEKNLADAFAIQYYRRPPNDE